jgi:toxin YoeB
MKRQLAWDPNAWADYLHWQQTDKQVLKRVNELIKDCLRAPFEGIGKPEVLKANLRGFWSRRITDERRLVYRVTDEQVLIIQCRFHY